MPPISYDWDKELWVKEMCDKCLTGILHCLDNESRMAYLLRDVALQPYPEIAAVLGQDVASTRQIITRARRKLKNFLEDQCALHNPQGRCACRMRRLAKEVDLPREYAELRKALAHTNVFRASEEIMARANYWKEFLASCHKPQSGRTH